MNQERSSLYNRHRPRGFGDLVGQEHVVRALANSLNVGRPAAGYLFSGPRGTGKTTTARILARCLNCQSSEGPTATPCGTCDSCRNTGDEAWLDVVEVDAASSARRIDEMRDWLETVRYGPIACRYRVTIMDEAHQIQDQAASALLKTLEEPPPHLVVILCTTHPWDILPTIRSRLQHFGLRKPGVANLVRVLARVSEAEGIQTSPEALDLVARAADGSYRDALGLLDQISAFGDGRVDVADAMDLLGVVERETLFRLVDCLAAGDAPGAFAGLEAAIEGGADAEHLIRALANHLRFVCLLQQGAEPREEWAFAPEEVDLLRAQANHLPDAQVVRGLDLIGDAEIRIRHGGADPRLQLELVAAKLARPALDASSSSLEARIERLERGSPVPAAPRADDVPPQPEPPATSAPADPIGPRAPSTAAAEAVPLDLAHLERMWPHVLTEFQAKAPIIAGFLDESRPLVVTGEGTVTIGLVGELRLRMLTRPDDHRLVAETLGRLVGRPVDVAFTLVAAPAPAAADDARDHHALILEIQREFAATEERD